MKTSKRSPRSKAQHPMDREHKRARLYEVIIVETTEGAGIDEDPLRPVEYYYHKDGNLIVRVDGWERDQQ